MIRRLAALLIAPFALANAPAPDPANVPIPETIRAMLDAALAGGNEGEIATIVKYARAADPLSGDAVLAIAEAWRRHRDDARTEHIREATFLRLWTGKAELGGFVTTGTTDTAGVTGTLAATREGIRWRQKFSGQVDYQESLGVTTRRHFLASYEPNYKIDDRAYVYGAAQYESDRTLGFLDRYSASVGLGYSAIKQPSIGLDLELGPAFRETSFTDDTQQASAAVRGTVAFHWKLLPGLTFTQAGAAYIQRYDSTIGGTSAIAAKLIGPLSAQLSYNIQYESEPPVGSVRTNTTSRVGLAYTF